MSKPLVFVPKERVPAQWRARRIYGVQFSPQGERDIREAINESMGDDDDGVAGSIMSIFILRTRVHDMLRDKHNMVAAYSDDVSAHICNELGIDWRQFEHNGPKLPIDSFIALARRKFAKAKLATNEVQWSVQHKQLWKAWRAWVERECARLGCLEDRHYDCGSYRYNEPNLWELAVQIHGAKEEGERMLASLDAKPRKRAVKAVDDALARIGVAAKA